MALATEDARLVMSEAHRSEITGIAEIIVMLAELPKESRPLHVRVVKNLLWVVTEYRPGFAHKVAGVRWRTPSAHDLIEARQTKGLRHEHVIERDWMARRLLEMPDTARDALWQYPSCIVTTDEHGRLSASHEWGWDRYRDADIPVIDAGTGRRVDLRRMASDLVQAYRDLRFLRE
jgi:hypothetical protein